MKVKHVTQKHLAEAGKAKDRLAQQTRLESDVLFRLKMHLCFIRGLHHEHLSRFRIRGKPQTAWLMKEIKSSRVKWRLEKTIS